MSKGSAVRYSFKSVRFCGEGLVKKREVRSRYAWKAAIVALTWLAVSSCRATALIDAARQGDLAGVNHLLAAGYDVNATDLIGGMTCTALTEAAERGYLDIVRTLLRVPGIKVNAVRGKALRGAAENRHLDVMRALLGAPGIDANLADVLGWTAMHWAALRGNPDAARALLGAPDIDVNPVDSHGRSPLFVAVSNGNIFTVQALLAAGANVNQAQKGGEAPLLVAADNGYFDVVRALLNAGAFVNIPDSRGQTPLHATAWRGHLDVVQVLLNAGAFVNAADHRGKTPLVYATSKRQFLIDNLKPDLPQGALRGDLQRVQRQEQIIDMLWQAGGREIGFQQYRPGAPYNPPTLPQ